MAPSPLGKKNPELLPAAFIYCIFFLDRPRSSRHDLKGRLTVVDFHHPFGSHGLSTQPNDAEGSGPCDVALFFAYIPTFKKRVPSVAIHGALPRRSAVFCSVSPH